MQEMDSIYLMKAREALAGAESEYANGRYNNCANRCYYSVFHAAVHALEDAGLLSQGSHSATPSHEAIQSLFVGQLVNRRKRYPSDLRPVLMQNQTLRNAADYERHWVTEVQAQRAVRRTRRFLEAILHERR